MSAKFDGRIGGDHGTRAGAGAEALTAALARSENPAANMYAAA